MNNQSVKRKIMTSLLPLTILSDQVNQLLHSLVIFDSTFFLHNTFVILFVDASWIRDIVVDLENSRIYYSIPSCTILNGDPLVVLNIANTNGDVVYNDEQSYNTELTSFNIPCSSLSNISSYNYSLLVTLSDRTVASYTGTLTSTTTMPTSVLPSSTDKESSHGIQL